MLIGVRKLHKIKYRIKSCMKTNSKRRISIVAIIARICHGVLVCVIISFLPTSILFLRNLFLSISICQTVTRSSCDFISYMKLT